MNKFYICAIIKDEHNYLAEWIEHHLSLGFDEIYLFEDFGSKSHKEITDNYPQVVLDTCDNYFEIKRDYDVGWARQTRLYQKFLNEHRDEGWCAFIDIDEYIVFNDGYTLQSLTEEYKDEYGIALYWKQFNANGRLYRAERVVETYTQACNCVSQDTYHAFKSLVNMHKARIFWSQHLIEHLADVNGETLSHSKPTKANFAKVQLNHYFCKSYEDWCDRFVRGDLAPSHRKFEQFFENNPEMRSVAYMKHIINRRRYKDFVSDDLISVCMCTYNRACYLDNVISNILNQTYVNIEFVIVDDGSTDNSREILDKWSSQDSRVRVIYSDHDFIKSRNLAFKEARGTFVACMDSDDECSLDRIEKQYKYLQEHEDVDIVGCWVANNPWQKAVTEFHEDLVSNWSPEHYNLGFFAAYLIRISLLEKFNHPYFCDLFSQGGEDQIFKLSALNYGAKFANVQETLYSYNRSYQSMTWNYKPDNPWHCFINGVASLNDALSKVKMLQESNSFTERLELLQAFKRDSVTQIALNAHNKDAICAVPVSDDFCFYVIGKCGCTTISELSACYYKESPIDNLLTNDFRGTHNIMTTPAQLDRTTILVYRDPVRRWKSWIKNKLIRKCLGSPLITNLREKLGNVNLEDILWATEIQLSNKPPFDIDSHIRPLYSHVDELKRVDYVVDIKDLQSFLDEHGLHHKIENSSGEYDIKLTPEQEAKLKELYARDYKLLDEFKDKIWRPSDK